MRVLIDDRARAMRLGEAGAATAARMTWADALQKLLLP
jgi:hypothetical protein